MLISRREFVQGLAGTAFLSHPSAAIPKQDGRTKEWDRAVLVNAVRRSDAAYDAKEALLVHSIGPEYHYHTNLRDIRAHITRDSLEYAMNLLETGEPDNKERAQKILDRMLDLQDKDPDSKWFGLWGYYMEEPPSKMAPADWNWADFNGATLLMLNARHGSELPPSMRKRVQEAVHNCAVSVMRRNVAMSYTNIAVQGTFVTLAAAALVGDEALAKYAHDRLLRFCATVDETGSFAEYNSPTYANVTIVNLVRMRMLLREPAVIAIVDRLEHRIWEHLGDHWHQPTRQIAGPMSRCYSTDIGKPLWLQKSLGGAVPFASLEEIRENKVHESGEVSYLEYNCPEDVRRKFLSVPDSIEHRELFLYTGKLAEPVEGVTYLARSFTIGSANRSDFWVQRRPLVAYWGGNGRPARYLQMRFMKDDYDFSSALFFSVQKDNFVGHIVSFRSPGGDKHPSLDPIQNGEFSAKRMRVRFDLAGAAGTAQALADGKPAKLDNAYSSATRLTIDLGGAFLGMQFHKAHFGGEEPKLILAQEEGMLTCSLDLLNAPQGRTVSWQQVKNAFAAGTITMSAANGTLLNFDKQFGSVSCDCKEQEGRVALTWKTPSGVLEVESSTAIQGVDRQNESAQFRIDGAPVPAVRLSNEKIAPASA